MDIQGNGDLGLQTVYNFRVCIVGALGLPGEASEDGIKRGMGGMEELAFHSDGRWHACLAQCKANS